MSTDDYFAPMMARIRAGAALLDEHAPGWLLSIDVTALDLGSTTWCILGQTYAPVVGDHWWLNGFQAGRDALGLSEDGAADYGFEAMGDEGLDPTERYSSCAYANLTDGWKNYIHERRAAGQESTDA